MEKTRDKVIAVKTIVKTVNKRKLDNENLPRLMRICSNGLILREVRPGDIDDSRTNITNDVSKVNCQNNNVIPTSTSVAKAKLESQPSKENGKCEASTQSCIDLNPLCPQHKEFFTSKKAKTGYPPDINTTKNSKTLVEKKVQKNVRPIAQKNIFNFVSVKCENEDPIPDKNSGKSTAPVPSETKSIPTPVGYKELCHGPKSVPVPAGYQKLCREQKSVPTSAGYKELRRESKPVPIPAGHGESCREPKSISTPAGYNESCQILSISIIMNNDRAMEFYTGLQNNSKFECVLKSLGRDAYDLKYYDSKLKRNLTVPDQFLLTLALLRQHKSHYEMSILFNVTLKDIKNIFITWVRFMRLEWNKIQLPEPYKPIQKPETTSGGTKKRSKKSEVEKGKSPKLVTIDLADDKVAFKKVYKILNGPQNYIEAHLLDDIIYICHVLCFFKAAKLQTKMPDSSVST